MAWWCRFLVINCKIAYGKVLGLVRNISDDDRGCIILREPIGRGVTEHSNQYGENQSDLVTSNLVGQIAC